VAAATVLERAAVWVIEWSGRLSYLDDPENPFQVDRDGPHF
jgi:hypothetical protein